jgi:hypothetical protein
MVIGEVAGQDAVEVEVSLVDDEHVIQAHARDRADEPLRERILPGAVWRREDLVNPPCPLPGAGTAGRRLGHDPGGDRAARTRSEMRSRSAGRVVSEYATNAGRAGMTRGPNAHYEKTRG